MRADYTPYSASAANAHANEKDDNAAGCMIHHTHFSASASNAHANAKDDDVA